MVVVDDHRMFAEGLARLLALEGDIEVLGVGGNGREAVTLVEQLRPRVLLLDFDMPEGNGVVAAREVKASRPETMIVMISGSTDDRLILRAVEAGCSGYLTKDRAASEVAYAVRTVAAGEALHVAGPDGQAPAPAGEVLHGMGSDLTERERDVLALLARGCHEPDDRRRAGRGRGHRPRPTSTASWASWARTPSSRRWRRRSERGSSTTTPRSDRRRGAAARTGRPRRRPDVA